MYSLKTTPNERFLGQFLWQFYLFSAKNLLTHRLVENTDDFLDNQDKNKKKQEEHR